MTVLPDLDVPVVGAPMAGGVSSPLLVAAVCDAGGLGIFIDTGYRLQDYTTLVVGSVLAVCLALFVDWLGGVGEILFNPKGLR